MIDVKAIEAIESSGKKIASMMTEEQKNHFIESYFDSPSEILGALSASARVVLHKHHEEKLGHALSGGEAAELHKPYFGAGLSEAVLTNIFPVIATNRSTSENMLEAMGGKPLEFRDLPLVGKYIGATVDTARVLSLATLTVTIVADLSVEVVNRGPGAATAAQKYIQDTAKAASALSILMVSSIVDACSAKTLKAGSSRHRSKSPKKMAKAKRSKY